MTWHDMTWRHDMSSWNDMFDMSPPTCLQAEKGAWHLVWSDFGRFRARLGRFRSYMNGGRNVEIDTLHRGRNSGLWHGWVNIDMDTHKCQSLTWWHDMTWRHGVTWRHDMTCSTCHPLHACGQKKGAWHLVWSDFGRFRARLGRFRRYMSSDI